MSNTSERTLWDYLAHVSENHSPIDFVLISDHLDKFLYGTLITLEITALSLLIGGLVAIPLAIARAQRQRGLNGVIFGFTYFFRGTPLLVQTYLFYYGLAQFEFIRESFLWDPILSKAWWCALIAFTLNTAAYTTEFLRGAIEKYSTRRDRGGPRLRHVTPDSSVAYRPTQRVSAGVTRLLQRGDFYAAQVSCSL